ncbi:MAG: hypothetical protein WDM84_05245 [Bauldia sp.]
MKNIVRAGVAALAFAALVAQPMVANAGTPKPGLWWWLHHHHHHHLVSKPDNYALPVAWGVGFLFCAGLTIGKQDVDAAKHHTKVTGRDRWDAFLSCAIPPLGLYKLYSEQKNH